VIGVYNTLLSIVASTETIALYVNAYAMQVSRLVWFHRSKAGSVRLYRVLRGPRLFDRRSLSSLVVTLA
jgi:hypothetical protein